MDKVKEIENSFNHGISIAERKNILVTGVKKIESFDNEEFLMETVMGFLVLKGEGLEYNNIVACCGSNISKVQIMQLIQCGAKEIVIAFDREYTNRKDRKNEQYYNKLYSLAKRYNLYCNMSFIFDFEDVLNEKDSPIDRGIENYLYLLNRRIKLNE